MNTGVHTECVTAMTRVLQKVFCGPGRPRWQAALLVILGVVGWMVSNYGALERRSAQSATKSLPQAGQDWSVASLGLAMKWIPPGTFRMGSTQAERDWATGPEGQGEASWYIDEHDPVEVRLTQGFWLGQSTVTRAMFRRFVETENYRTEAERLGKARTLNLQIGLWYWREATSWRDPGFEQSDSHPAVCISWSDAKAFCDWLSRTERVAGRLPDGYEYRPPWEAEWEYAARGGQQQRTTFWWGDDWRDAAGRLNGLGSDRLPDGNRWTPSYDWEDGFAFTSPAGHYGSRGRNGYGLSDMLGNAWEWCFAGYQENGPHAKILPGSADQRVQRGGSFGNLPGYLRCAVRTASETFGLSAADGFRICLGPVVCVNTQQALSMPALESR